MSPEPMICTIVRHEDGSPSMSFESAEISCGTCVGWKGVECPHGCGVRLVSTQHEDTVRLRERQNVEKAERDAYRAERRAERDRRRLA